MAKIGKLPAREITIKPSTTPFDMVEVTIGESRVLARPYELSGDPNDPNTRPTKLSTSCPSCGHGILIDVKLGEVDIRGSCGDCGAGQVAKIEPLEDPFLNPIAEGKISESDINPLYAVELLTTPKASAADSIAVRRKIAKKLETTQAAYDDECAPPSSVLDLGEEPDLEG